MAHRTRRRFITSALSSIPTLLLSACGGRSLLEEEWENAAEGGSGGTPARGGAPPSNGSGGKSSTPGAGATTSGGAGGSSSTGAAGGESSAGGAAGAGGTSSSNPGTCSLYPQQTQGPFYVPDHLVRSDIVEDRAGVALALEIEVVNPVCAPIGGLAVDIWHCDAAGLYSGFPKQLGGVDTSNQTFLRGTQITGSNGIVRFHTIYPGWYPGRSTHIHFKVRVSPNLEATSQLYFPEDVTQLVYESAPYDARGQKDTSNVADSVNRGAAPVAAVTPTPGGHLARLRVTIA
jgi:protocatechuate 3,4-dioxygenase beta subunit